MIRNRMPYISNIMRLPCPFTIITFLHKFLCIITLSKKDRPRENGTVYKLRPTKKVNDHLSGVLFFVRNSIASNWRLLLKGQPDCITSVRLSICSNHQATPFFFFITLQAESGGKGKVLR